MSARSGTWGAVRHRRKARRARIGGGRGETGAWGVTENLTPNSRVETPHAAKSADSWNAWLGREDSNSDTSNCYGAFELCWADAKIHWTSPRKEALLRATVRRVSAPSPPPRRRHRQCGVVPVTAEPVATCGGEND